MPATGESVPSPCGKGARGGERNTRSLLRASVLAFALLLTTRAFAADIETARRVVTMIYDISLYDSELDRIMDEADSRGIYGGPGSTVATRARDKSFTRATMLAQRDSVLSQTTQRLAARATDQQLDALLQMADNKQADQALVGAAVSAVKASFAEAMWDQLARTARGNSMFPCTKDIKNRC